MFQVTSKRWFMLCVTAILSGALSPCYAGMPITPFRISELAALRIQALSFFVVLFFVLAFVLKIVWNTLAKDFKFMPRISYLRSLCLMFIWGMTMSVLLTMISAARELMTPGAWERVGWVYHVAEPGMNLTDYEQWKLARKHSLERLSAELIAYAKAHDGQFPPHRYVPEIPAEHWQSLAPSQTAYVYVPDMKIGEEFHETMWEPDREGKSRLLAIVYEPDGMSRERWYILSDGSLVLMNDNQAWSYRHAW